MTLDPIRAALERLIKLNDTHEDDRTWEPWTNAIEAARAALAAAPEGEVGGLIQCLRIRAASLGAEGASLGRRGDAYYFTRAATLLSQLSAVAPPAPPEGKVGELVDELELMANQAATACQFGDAMTLSDAATLLSQLSAAAPAVVPDGPAVPESREPASVAPEITGPSRPLSPAAQAVLDSVASSMEGGWISPDFVPYEGRKIAAAFCAVADQVVPEPPMIVPGGRSYEGAWSATVQDAIRRQILAIAAELEKFND